MKSYTLVAIVKSMTDSHKEYKIKRDEQGKLSCNCPSWIFQHKPACQRICKHIESYLGKASPKAFAKMPKVKWPTKKPVYNDDESPFKVEIIEI